MDKAALVGQLIEKLEASALVAEAERDAAAIEARDGATPGERVESSRIALEFSRIARAQALRAREIRIAIEALKAFRPRPLAARARVELGALIEVEDEEGHGQTLFLAPVGAGEELIGPGGDGFFTVVTPGSPIGSAVLGKREGEGASARIRGEVREWTVVWVG
jgi:transcription elongation GreA/GreB family factor